MKWFHAIGISGKATANIAKMFQDMGWFVTGSDLQFFPPASDILKKNNINTVEGYNFIHLTRDFWKEKLNNESLDISENPDLTMIIELATPKNKEYLFAKKKNLDVRPYSNILGEYLVNKNSIVVVGTAGKTTTTSLITYLLKNLGLNPSYMIGADVKDLENSLEKHESDWSVLEGDEYYNPEITEGAKFLQYKPKYVVMTKVTWEHQDIYPSEDRYVEEFEKLAKITPKDGILLGKYGDSSIDKIFNNFEGKKIRYSYSKSQEIIPGIWNVVKDENIAKIFDDKGKEILSFKTKLLGDYNLENILSSVILLLNIPELESRVEEIRSKLPTLIENFQGPKKRLEILFDSEKFTVIDDFGVVPERAFNSLNTIREKFPKSYIMAIYEPNSASRQNRNNLFNEMYKNSFQNADLVILPEFSTFNEDLLSSQEMEQKLNELKFTVKSIKTEDMKSYIKDVTGKISDRHCVIVFFSSYRMTEIASYTVNLLSVNLK